MDQSTWTVLTELAPTEMDVDSTMTITSLELSGSQTISNSWLMEISTLKSTNLMLEGAGHSKARTSTWSLTWLLVETGPETQMDLPNSHKNTLLIGSESPKLLGEKKKTTKLLKAPLSRDLKSWHLRIQLRQLLKPLKFQDLKLWDQITNSSNEWISLLHCKRVWI